MIFQFEKIWKNVKRTHHCSFPRGPCSFLFLVNRKYSFFLSHNLFHSTWVGFPFNHFLIFSFLQSEAIFKLWCNLRLFLRVSSFGRSFPSFPVLLFPSVSFVSLVSRVFGHSAIPKRGNSSAYTSLEFEYRRMKKLLKLERFSWSHWNRN